MRLKLNCKFSLSARESGSSRTEIDGLVDIHLGFIDVVFDGQVVCGKDFDQAFERAMFFEMGCRIAALNGDNVDPLTAAEVGDLESYFLGKEGK